MKKDYITFDLSKGALTAVGVATFSVAFLNLVIKLISKDFGAADEMKTVISVIPSVNIGVTAIFYLVAGCLSLQYMRFLMLFGATRTTAFMRYIAKVLITFIPTLLFMIVISLISGAFSGITLIPYGDYIISFLTSALFCFAAGCFFASITTLFRPFISFIVIASLCVSFLTLSGYAGKVTGLSDGSGYFSIPAPFVTVLISAAVLFLASVIHHVRVSDMKTTSIS